MNGLTIKIFGVIGFLIITVWCLLDSTERIPVEISRNVVQKLQRQQLSLDSIRVSGRDVFLLGVLPDSTSLEKVLRLTASVPGVWHVKHELRVIPPKPPDVQRSLNDLLATRRIEFQLRSDRILAASDSLLEKIVLLLQRYPLAHIEIRGHTDSTGSPAFNLILSQRRADAVKNYLISKGIPSERLSARGYGASQPVESNATPEGRGKNRRVEFIVLEEQ